LQGTFGYYRNERRFIMNDRRGFLKKSVLVATGVVVGSSGKLFASSGAFPKGIVYAGESPGKWAGKAGSHAPRVQVDGLKVTITTNHPMSEKHYIVRHTLVTVEGKVIGEKTFYPSDEEAVSRYELESYHSARIYATSFCNLHDLWVTEFTA
jgi:superoxide reductase